MRYGRLITGFVFIGAGVAHLLAQEPLAAIIPKVFPAHRTLVQLSGVTAIAGGLGLLWYPLQRAAAWGLVAWLVAVFPANLWIAVHPEAFPRIAPWLLWARLPLQIPMIWWVWRYTRRESQDRTVTRAHDPLETTSVVQVKHNDAGQNAIDSKKPPASAF